MNKRATMSLHVYEGMPSKSWQLVNSGHHTAKDIRGRPTHVTCSARYGSEMKVFLTSGKQLNKFATKPAFLSYCFYSPQPADSVLSDWALPAKPAVLNVAASIPSGHLADLVVGLTKASKGKKKGIGPE